MRLIVPAGRPTDLDVLDASPADLASVRDALTFRDRGVEFLIHRHKRKNWLKEQDPERYEQELEALKKQLKRCLLIDWEDRHSTLAGLAEDLVLSHPGTTVSNEVEYPEPSNVAWEHVPEHENRKYQDEAKTALLAAKHAAIQLPTGAGKSTIIRDLAHDIGYQTTVMSPSASIARQLYEDFTHHFGRRNVGLYGDGKKEMKKFTIAIAASLVRIEPGTDAWDHFSKTVVFQSDESHMNAAETLERVCTGVVRSAPYRFFFSATQTRTDGAEMLLKGITGPIVYEKQFKDLVDEGFLSKPQFKMVRVPSTHWYQGDDAMKATQNHLYYNPAVLQKASLIANGLARRGQRVLILVDEIPQFAAIQKLLTVEARFAHGGVTKDNRGKLPEQYWKSDPQALVKAFDRGEFPVLVGTSCISMGTDIRSPETVIYLQGGTSAIQVPQAVGRGTRRGFLFPDGHKKSGFNFIDFCPVVTNNAFNDDDQDASINRRDREPMSIPFRHALARARLYQNLYPGALSWM